MRERAAHSKRLGPRLEPNLRAARQIARRRRDRGQVNHVLRWICQKRSGSSCPTSSLSGARISASPSAVNTLVYLSFAWK